MQTTITHRSRSQKSSSIAALSLLKARAKEYDYDPTDDPADHDEEVLDRVRLEEVGEDVDEGDLDEAAASEGDNPVPCGTPVHAEGQEGADDAERGGVQLGPDSKASCFA